MKQITFIAQTGTADSTVVQAAMSYLTNLYGEVYQSDGALGIRASEGRFNRCKVLVFSVFSPVTVDATNLSTKHVASRLARLFNRPVSWSIQELAAIGVELALNPVTAAVGKAS